MTMRFGTDDDDAFVATAPGEGEGFSDEIEDEGVMRHGDARGRRIERRGFHPVDRRPEGSGAMIEGRKGCVGGAKGNS